MTQQADMAPKGLKPMHWLRSAAWRARLPRRTIAWTLAVVAVLWLHSLALQELRSVLPGLAGDTALPQAFTTRTVSLPAPATTPTPTSDNEVAAPKPSSPPVGQPAPRATAAPARPAQTAQAPTDATAMTRPAPTAGDPAPPQAADPATLASAPSPPASSQPLPTSAATAPAGPAKASASAAATAAPPVGSTPGTAAVSAVSAPVYDYLIPGSTRLKYEVSGRVKGFGYHVSGELLWLQDGKTYDARLEMSHFLLGSRVQTSKGAITAQGLEPLRFGDKVRSEVAAHFERTKGKVSFSANTPDAPLLPMAQDQLSVFMQLASMWGGKAARFAPGMQLPFQAVGPRSAESWVIVVGETERLKVDGRELPAVKLLRERSADYDVRVELWLAPALEYLPARIRLTQSNGDEVDMLWSKSEKP